ncbi:MAG: ribonucleoside-diphosphate reductase subunit alpha [Sulfobacillus sp.]
MLVIKRDGSRQEVDFNKITERLQRLCRDNSIFHADPLAVAQQTIVSLFSGVTTEELDLISADVAASFSSRHPEYSRLAGAICVSNLHKNTGSFAVTMGKLHDFTDAGGNASPLISDEFWNVCCLYADRIEEMLDYSRDYLYDFFGFKTLERSYLMRINGKTVERPQHMLMRVSLAIHGKENDLERVRETYDLMSRGAFIHATPTLFNAGTRHPQFSSCFLLSTSDSLQGIFKTVSDCASISKWAGGIGVAVSDVRAKGSLIRGTNGESMGIVPMLKTYESVARYINQGSKRPGSIAVYLEPWHADVLQFLELRKNTGAESERTRDLFLALWVPDLFMERVRDNGTWSLMCPDKCPGLTERYGDQFRELYLDYERQNRYERRVPAVEVWRKVMESQIETGVPYICFKDAANRKCNQKNLGTIKCSNLCAEITEYSSTEEYAVCNLASISLPSCVVRGAPQVPCVVRGAPQVPCVVRGAPQVPCVIRGAPQVPCFDHQKLHAIAGVVVRNLDRIIDLNFYPTQECRESNLRHRPVGVGIQGLADVFCMLSLPFESPEAAELNRDIMETIYHGCLSASMELAKEKGAYASFAGSPFSRGLLQLDLDSNFAGGSGRWDWEQLRRDIVSYGTRNSLLTALMPTASTSQILGNNECFEPFTSNLYKRKTLAGEFMVINRHLVRDLESRGLWSDDVRKQLVLHRGSVQQIAEVPDDLKLVYRTAWEIRQKSVVDLAAGRSPFVDQSQSMNVFMSKPDYDRLHSVLFHAWRQGLKTGCYYLRSAPAADAQQFSLEANFVKEAQGVCRLRPGQDCAMCSG